MIALFVLFLLLTIVALVGVSATTGAVDITVNDVYSSILRKTFPDHFESKSVSYTHLTLPTKRIV